MSLHDDWPTPRPFRKSQRAPASAVLLAAAITVTAGAPLWGQEITRDPQRVRIETADLDRFAAALATGGKTSADLTAALERVYLAVASPGLRAWVDRYELSAARISAGMRRRPDMYAAADRLRDMVHDAEPALRAAFENLRSIFPAAAYPPVWFFVGAAEAGGLARPEGVLIATETLAPDPAGLVPLVMHELAHFQSALLQGIDVYRRIYGPDQTLLALALREGSADFIAELTAGAHINPAADAFGRRHERELWEEFRRVMHDADTGEWMFVRPADPDRPTDLGYWIGYRIVESYYRHAPDKAAAVLDILNLTDFAAFLAASRYAEQWDPRS